jgi:FlaA1/EpsC-like NDP-sugar epimerase
MAAAVQAIVGQCLTLSPSVRSEDIRPVTPSDLLGRRVIETQSNLIGGYTASKRVLITGAR